MENVYVLKGSEAKKNSLKNFRIKFGDRGDWTNLWESCKKLAWRQDEAAELKEYRIFLVFYYVIFVHKLDIILKRNKSFVCKFSQLQFYQILLKSVDIWPSNHKNETGKLFETPCIYAYYCDSTVLQRVAHVLCRLSSTDTYYNLVMDRSMWRAVATAWRLSD